MKIVFAGTPEFAVQAMRAIHDAGHEIVLVFTQPDRRAGRGMHLQASPVKTLALEYRIPVLQPLSLRSDSPDPQKQMEAREAYQQLVETDFDAMVVVAYGLILPQGVLDIAQKSGRHGCFNIHASLLPRWRGAAPIQRAIEAGDYQSGVSIMKMDAGLDTGDTVLTEAIEITTDETSATLYDRLALIGAKLIVQTLDILEKEKAIQTTPQKSEGITYAEKILKSEAEIDWNLSAQEIDRRIRAFNPFPGATGIVEGASLKCWRSRLPLSNVDGEPGEPGELLGFSEDGAYIQCGKGILELLEMQRSGGKKLSAKKCLQVFVDQHKQIRFQLRT
jgi:methionyl-tRNA formyltransferase